MDALAEQGIDALIADRDMRRRHSINPNKYAGMANPLHDKRPKTKTKPSKYFEFSDFIVADDGNSVTCPNGKTLPRSGKDYRDKNSMVTNYRAPMSACRECPLRSQCLRKTHAKAFRQVAYLREIPGAASLMRERIDSELGREL